MVAYIGRILLRTALIYPLMSGHFYHVLYHTLVNLSSWSKVLSSIEDKWSTGKQKQTLGCLQMNYIYQTWVQVHWYLYLSTISTALPSTCKVFKYFLLKVTCTCTCTYNMDLCTCDVLKYSKKYLNPCLIYTCIYM